VSSYAHSAVRCYGGREREAMRALPPLAGDHPLVRGDGECPICDHQFVAGEVTTIVPLGPGPDLDDREKAVNGRPYTAMGLIAHADCAGLNTSGAV
jgi:hypothetical protein